MVLSTLMKGIIQITTKGTGYIPHEKFTQDIEISHENLNTALNGDTVEFEVSPAKKDRPEGKVVKVIKRKKIRFVGTVEKEGACFFLIPDDQKMYRDILLSKKSSRNIEENHKIVVEIDEWVDIKKDITGKIIKKLGLEGTHDVEMQAIVLAKGFDIDFPESVTKEAKEIKKTITEKEISNRRDMRGTTTFTIDPADAKDFDDALSFKKLPDGNYEIGVHIADVSHYVRENSSLDMEAQNRGFSVYLVDRTIPMLPLELSTDICSLNPNEDRLAFSSIFTINKEGEILDEWFGKTIIHSDQRFSYEEAQKVLDSKTGDLADELLTLLDISKKLEKKNSDEGAIDFETTEMKFKLDKNGVPIEIYKKEHLATHKLIEEYMLLANKRVAELMYHALNKQEKESQPGQPDKNPANPFIYRVHELPNPEKLENLTRFLKALGYDAKLNKRNITTFDVKNILQLVKGKPEESFVKTATIRSMSKAVYSTKNAGHFGLSFQYYTHFTSPIRRYSDLLVHRLLFKHLQGEKLDVKDTPKYQHLAVQISENEIAASEAERDSIKYKQVEYMTKHVKEMFDARISGVTEYGLYVQDKETLAEGLLHISELKGDYYNYDEKTDALIGEKKKKKFQLGDDIKVKLDSADMEKRQLNFIPAPSSSHQT